MRRPVAPWQSAASLALARRLRPQIETRQDTPLQQFMQMRRVGRNTPARVVINDDTAMKISAVFCSVRILSGIAGSLPVTVYEKKGTGLADAKVHEHPVAALLGEPNDTQVPCVFEERRQAHLSMWGNDFTAITWDSATGDPISLDTHHPYNVEPRYDDQGRLLYRTQTREGVRWLDRSEMIHTPGFGFDGLLGLSTISLAANSLGIAASGDNLAATFNGNAAKPFLIVTTPSYLDDGPFNRLSREINEEYSGDNSFGSLLLEGGATANFATMPLKDAQFLESRKFQGEEIAARWFGLPPHLAGYLDRAHFDNVEEQDRALLVFTLGPLLVRKEQEYNRKLFNREDRRRFYVKYNVDALLRGQQRERYEAYTKAIQAGWKTVNEVRAKEDLPPLPGGDVLPRPAAIWGSPEESPPPEVPPEESTETRSDPRLLALAVDVLTGLQQAERIHAERAARHPDAEYRLREWYEGHERKALDKLRSLAADPGLILDHYREHRNALLTALRDPHPQSAIEACVAGWTEHPQRLADRITH